MTDDDRDLRRGPDGYELTFDEIGVVIDARRIRWEHGSLYAMVSVRTRMKGVKTVGGVVTETRVNLSSDRGRKDVAAACKDRAPDVDLDWRGLMEEFSIRILAAERQGRPFKAVGKLPQRIDPGHTIWPLFPAGRPAFIYGPPAATKGFLAIAFCLSVETGHEIIPGFKPRKGRSLYLDWESDEWDIDERVKKIAAGAGIPGRPEIGYRECIGPLNDQVEDIVREVARAGVTFVVIDSVGMALSISREGGDANESVIRMFQALRPLLAGGVTVILIDHVTGSELGSRSRSSKPYGSVYKLALARNTFEVRPLPPQPGEDHVRHVVIRHRKANSSAYLPDMGFALTFDHGTVAFTAEEVKAPDEETEESESTWPTSARVRMRRALQPGVHMTPGELAEAIDEKIDTVERVLRRYGPKASKAENRWFNRLPSGKYEALPLDSEVLAKAEIWPRTDPAGVAEEEPDDESLEPDERLVRSRR